MARPKSEDKSKSILDAATAVFAERGFWSTPTSAISKAAGVAEGTLFTYFKTKDDLVNALYRSLKVELAGILLEGWPPKGDLRARFKHIWDRYVDWGIKHPDKYKVMTQLRMSDKITEETRSIAAAPFADLEVMVRDCVKKKLIRDLSMTFLGAMISGMAEATMEVMAQQPKSKSDHRANGFEVFWNGVSK